MSSTVPQVATLRAYRSLIRQFRLTSIKSRTTRNPVMVATVRSLFEKNRDVTDEVKLNELRRDAANMGGFLSGHRIHSELLERYNPLHGQTPEERIHQTARRVGLDVPVQYMGPEGEAELPIGGKKE